MRHIGFKQFAQSVTARKWQVRIHTHGLRTWFTNITSLKMVILCPFNWGEKQVPPGKLTLPRQQSTSSRTGTQDWDLKAHVLPKSRPSGKAHGRVGGGKGSSFSLCKWVLSLPAARSPHWDCPSSVRELASGHLFEVDKEETKSNDGEKHAVFCLQQAAGEALTFKDFKGGICPSHRDSAFWRLENVDCHSLALPGSC